jgi:GT2 family glycosyltransferase
MPAPLDVVIVTHESSASLAACLEVLPDRVVPIVADNASTDGSVELAERLGARVVRTGGNLGFAAAANRAAARGAAELVLFLNPDAAIAGEALARLADALAAEPANAVAGPRLVAAAGGDQRAWWPFPSPARTWLEAFGVHRLHPDRPGEDGSVAFVIGAAMLVRRAAFESVGGFDERFWLYGEEADLCRRLAGAGWRVLYVPEAVATHVGGASSTADPALVFEHFQRGTEHFVAKHHGRAGLVSHRLGLLVGSLVRLPLLAARSDPASRRDLATRRAVVRRLLHVLVTRPTQVAG